MNNVLIPLLALLALLYGLFKNARDNRSFQAVRESYQDELQQQAYNYALCAVRNGMPMDTILLREGRSMLGLRVMTLGINTQQHYKDIAHICFETQLTRVTTVLSFGPDPDGVTEDFGTLEDIVTGRARIGKLEYPRPDPQMQALMDRYWSVGNGGNTRYIA